MNEIYMAFLVTILAGLSTMIGLFPILFQFKNENRFISICLSFTAGVMLCLSITDLIPESIQLLEKEVSGILVCLFSFCFLFLGIFISSYIDKKILVKNHSLYKVGIISMIAMIMHNIPEGIITFIGTTTSKTLGIRLGIAIALHNIPEGISIGIPIYYATKKKGKALGYTLISALSEPLGAFLAYLFLMPFINNLVLGFLFSVIAGIMIQISIIELLPTSYQYGDDKKILLFFVIGVIVMLLRFFVL